jgi:two-component system, response regulator PdtaR
MLSHPSDSAGRRHALIIEDEIIVGLDVQSVLSDLGFTSFAFASTARQALEQVRLRRPDLVTADVNLLDGDGVDVAQALQAAYGPFPVVFVTGDLSAAGRVGPATFVSKPFAPDALRSACARMIAAVAH